jgi:hypothetical protein
MADSGAAYDPDRLPWLTEERKPRRRKSHPVPLLLWALLAGLLVAGVSYWLGMQSVTEPAAVSEPAPTAPPAATVTLPAPKPTVSVPPADQVQPPPMRDVEPVAEPAPVRIEAAPPARKARPRASRRVSAKPHARVVVHRSRPAPPRKTAAVKRSPPMQAWPASVSAGAYGRVVRIGAYGTRYQAKRGWWSIIRRYPGMRRLKAVVAPVQSRNGRIYYRLQFGTTSQAHSEVLCQRMRAIRQSCAVIGLPPARGARR